MPDLPTLAPAPGPAPDPALPEEPLAARLALGGRSLRRVAARGTIINAAFLVAVDSLGLLKGFVVAAYLSASDYGVWGILLISLGTLLWLRQVGIGDKYVQQTEADQEAAFQKAFTLEAAFTGLFALVVLAAAPLVAFVYGRAELLAPGLVLVALLPAGVLQAPTWIYYRDLRYARQRALQAVDPIVGFAVTVALAVTGAGYWSLVLGVLAGSWAGAIVAVAACPYRLRLRWERGTLREYASFSWPLLVAGASGMAIAQVSILLGEAELGLAGVGAISLASAISVYTDRVDQIVTATLYPAICAVKDRTELLFETFVKSNRLALMWGVPFGAGLALFAADLVEFGIGERWRPAVGLLQVFGLIAAANHIGFNWTAFFRARGETRPIAVANAVVLVAFTASAVPLLLSHGLGGFALGMAITTAVALVVRSLYLVRLFPGFQMARHAARAIAPTIPAASSVLLVRTLDGSPRGLATALGELALYLAVTAAATALFERALLREVLGYLRGAPEPGTAAAA